VTLSGGGTNIHNAATATLGANASGGLTKLGGGSLALNAANTYGGTTAVSNGTLSLGAAGALPEGSDIVLSGGILDLGTFTVTGGGSPSTPRSADTCMRRLH
jgi:autotransporter-associated beta strand protein